MLRNYFIIAFRNIQKNAVYSFINIGGLAIGITCSLLIMLWVNDELTFDHFNKNKDRLAQVFLNNPGDNGIITQRSVSLPIAEYLKSNEPGIKYVAPTDWGSNHLLVHGEQRLIQEGLFAGEDFLKMFSFDLIQGTSELALKEPNSIVLTESLAQSLFGTTDAMGKSIQLDNTQELVVTGVVKDVPTNSSIQFQYLLPFSLFINTQQWVRNAQTQWGNNSFQMYVQLADNVSKNEVEERVRKIVQQHDEESRETEVIFHSMTDWRLFSQFKNGRPAGGGIENVRMFSIIAIAILLIACINFMNLATARSERRAREVGIRKAVGSRRKELIVQFIGESMLVAFLAFILAVCLTEAMLPLYNNLVDKKLFIDYTSSVFWLASLSVVVGTGVIAGSYPAFYLSSFNAATVLKGKSQSGRGGSLPRKILVTLQFGFSIFLIIGTIAFNSQIELGKSRDLGYDQENMLIIENNGDIAQNYQIIKNELLQQNLASSVTKSNSPITAIYSYMGNVNWPGKTENQRAAMATVATEYDYTKTMGIKLLDGRDFDIAHHDSLSMLLNKAAVDYMGLKEPVGSQIEWNERQYTIVGVTENVLMSGVYTPVDPMMIIFDPQWFSDMTVRLPATQNMSESIAKIETVFRKHNPAYPFTYRFADVEFGRKFVRLELISNVANTFAVLAIIISCLGLFGLAAFTAEQRTKEIGIRKVMGASVSGVVMLLTKDFARLVIVSFVLTSPIAWWAMDSWLSRFTYRIELQWWMLGIAGGLAMLLAVVTVSSQAFKAAVNNPANSLRSE